MLAGHPHATLERMRAQAEVLLGQDTTALASGTTQPQKGMGTVQSNGRAESLRQATGAFLPARRNLGGWGLQVWPRPEPLAWRWRTRLPVVDCPSAWLVRQGSQGRGERDLLFRGLTPGCQIEP
jgi:hypothetical protein